MVLQKQFLQLIRELLLKGTANDCFKVLEKLVGLSSYYNHPTSNEFALEINIILQTALRAEKTGGDFHRPIWLTVVF
jgi:hypothetical protein